MMRSGLLLMAVALPLASGCGYNSLVSADESVKAAWAQVENVYQRRADLVPNLVNTVKGSAQHEEKVLTEVTAARAQATQVKLSVDDLSNPEKVKQFEDAQAKLSSSLGRLIATSEAYPDLKANAAFRDLMAQLEGTENRISVERKRYNDAVRDYNVKTREFPTVIMAKISGLPPEGAVQGDHGECESGAGGEVLKSLAAALLLLFALPAQALSVPARPDGPINDYANVLTADAKARLTQQLDSYALGTTRQIAVAIFPALDGEERFDFSMRLAEAWKLGGKKNSDGVLVTRVHRRPPGSDPRRLRPRRAAHRRADGAHPHRADGAALQGRRLRGRAARGAGGDRHGDGRARARRGQAAGEAVGRRRRHFPSASSSSSSSWC